MREIAIFVRINFPARARFLAIFASCEILTNFLIEHKISYKTICLQFGTMVQIRRFFLTYWSPYVLTVFRTGDIRVWTLVGVGDLWGVISSILTLIKWGDLYYGVEGRVLNSFWMYPCYGLLRKKCYKPSKTAENLSSRAIAHAFQRYSVASSSNIKCLS